MISSLELELKTYGRERARLEDEHPGKFVIIRGKDIVAVFDDFRTASEHAARSGRRASYLIHCIGTELTDILMLLDGLAALDVLALRMQATA